MANPETIGTIAFPTANRAATLLRAARSYLEHSRRHGRELRIAVADGSPDRESLEALRTLDAPLDYLGNLEKKELAVRLSRESGVPLEVVEFGIGDPLGVGFSPGANRNTLLLRLAGQRFYSADDDTICSPIALTAGTEPFELSEAFNPTRVWPYESLDALESRARFAERDLFALHEGILGQDIRGRRVRVSWTGIAGDSGYRSPMHLFDLDGAAHAELVRSERAYLRMLTGRQLLRAPVRPTITPGGFCQSTSIALDAAGLLPPYLPVLRGEDWIFARLLRQCLPGGAIAYLPFCVLHVPPEPREHRHDELEALVSGRSVLPLFNALMREAGAGGLEETGRKLSAFLRLEAFAEFARAVAQAEASGLVKKLERTLDSKPGAPDYFVRDVRRVLAALQAAAAEPEYCVPEELGAGGLERLREVLLRFATLLEAWPALFKAALRLGEAT